jgi:hypothetical protein
MMEGKQMLLLQQKTGDEATLLRELFWVQLQHTFNKYTGLS